MQLGCCVSVAEAGGGGWPGLLAQVEELTARVINARTLNFHHIELQAVTPIQVDNSLKPAFEIAERLLYRSGDSTPRLQYTGIKKVKAGLSGNIRQTSVPASLPDGWEGELWAGRVGSAVLGRSCLQVVAARIHDKAQISQKLQPKDPNLSEEEWDQVKSHLIHNQLITDDDVIRMDHMMFDFSNTSKFAAPGRTTNTTQAVNSASAGSPLQVQPGVLLTTSSQHHVGSSSTHDNTPMARRNTRTTSRFKPYIVHTYTNPNKASSQHTAANTSQAQQQHLFVTPPPGVSAHGIASGSISRQAPGHGTPLDPFEPAYKAPSGRVTAGTNSLGYHPESPAYEPSSWANRYQPLSPTYHPPGTHSRSPHSAKGLGVASGEYRPGPVAYSPSSTQVFGREMAERMRLWRAAAEANTSAGQAGQGRPSAPVAAAPGNQGPQARKATFSSDTFRSFPGAPPAAAPAAAPAPGVPRPPSVQQHTPLSDCIGKLVCLRDVYDPALQHQAVCLEKELGRGGFAAVFLGRVVPLTAASGGDASSGSGSAAGTQPAAAAAAAAAAGTGTAADGFEQLPAAAGTVGVAGTTVAVKVYFSQKPGWRDAALQQFAANELKALNLLRGNPNVVQLLATGQVTNGEGRAGAAAAAGVTSAVEATAAAAGGGKGCTVSNQQQAGSSKQPDTAQNEMPLLCAVLEKLEGAVDERLTRFGPYTVERVRHVAKQLLQPLHAMRSGQLGSVIVHRDLKCANLLLTSDDVVKVADFGVSRIEDVPAGYDAAHHVGAVVPLPVPVRLDTSIGSLYHMAPEVFSRGRGAGFVPGYDASIDMWGLGVCVMEMLAGGLHGVGPFGQAAPGVDIYQRWCGKVAEFVNGSLNLPGLTDSDAGPGSVRHFVRCCCGIDVQRMTPGALLQHPWLLGKQDEGSS